ncbi:hypothetical protein NADFUDRAFT_84052 [Nadsonia fulvescens var. elongata DSM 6958]|uniref:Myb-like domain-containing protein n=1 Tax=Nadsonia fulvescens var. elongata DSM 6958 TaxID=857566 RepID=A0A1E3PF48_9ASCO|nr:hypothetical protein NADFUDRAFT_84052 [Nadsonia fulvescens var. elongata DSM 6958]
MLEPNQLIKVNRKERRAFTSDEDERLLKGFLKHGPSWSKIQRDVTLDLCNRRSTDLRDRFRNAFPDRYAAAGFKGRRSHANLEKKEALVANGNMLTKFAEGSSANDKRPYTQDTLSALDSTAAEAFNLADQYNQQQKPLIQSQQQIQYQPQQHPQHNHLQQHNLLQHQLQRQPKHYQEPHSNYRAQEKQLNMTHLPLNQQRKSPQLQSDRLQNQPHNQKSNPQQQYQGTSATPQSFGISNLVSGNNMNSDITEEADMSIRPDTDSHVQRAGYMQHPQGLQDQPQHQQQQLHQQQIQKQQHQQQHQQLYYQEQSANAAMYYSHLYPSGTQTS